MLLIRVPYLKIFIFAFGALTSSSKFAVSFAFANKLVCSRELREVLELWMAFCVIGPFKRFFVLSTWSTAFPSHLSDAQ